MTGFDVLVALNKKTEMHRRESNEKLREVQQLTASMPDDPSNAWVHELWSTMQHAVLHRQMESATRTQARRAYDRVVAQGLDDKDGS
jgi:hypothetical protein